MGKLRENWAASFEHTDRGVWCLEYNRELDLALYVTKAKVPADEANWWSYYEPMYHVWQGDDWLGCSSSLEAANNTYRLYEDAR